MTHPQANENSKSEPTDIHLPQPHRQLEAQTKADMLKARVGSEARSAEHADTLARKHRAPYTRVAAM
jgi:hypothetical protein